VAAIANAGNSAALHAHRPLRIVFWGTYDLGKPRVRLLLSGARSLGMEVVECHRSVWEGIEDKSRLVGVRKRLLLLLRWVCAYPSLILRFLLLPRHDAVVVGYMGQVDVLVLWLFARLRGVPILWDAFLSIYDTVVNDRKMVLPGSLSAKCLYALDFAACRAANKIFLDTKAHALFFEKLFRLPPDSVGRVFVGAETDVFIPGLAAPRKDMAKYFTVLFYGQFIPLHGIEVIIRAAKLFEEAGEKIQWVIIGDGQEGARIDDLTKNLEVENITRIRWIPYSQLVEWIRMADVCLGIFGTSDKASRVIPNKVYQIISVKRPLITADTPAIRELLDEGPCVHFVPAGDPQALVSAVRKIRRGRNSVPGAECEGQHFPVIGPKEVGCQLKNVFMSVLTNT
jgi:glycosyltransferase involved in cell wall biosynthesis